MQGPHLVVHQRNQGRNDDSHALTSPLAGNGRYLVAQRFTAARGHEHQGVTAAAYVLDDGLLGAAKALEAKYFLQDVGVGHREGFGCGQSKCAKPPIVPPKRQVSRACSGVLQCPPVLHRLCHMGEGGGWGVGEVGNRAGNFQRAVGAARGPTQLRRRAL